MRIVGVGTKLIGVGTRIWALAREIGCWYWNLDIGTRTSQLGAEDDDKAFEIVQAPMSIHPGKNTSCRGTPYSDNACT